VRSRLDGAAAVIPCYRLWFRIKVSKETMKTVSSHVSLSVKLMYWSSGIWASDSKVAAIAT
jgi:hypothetical protein